MDKKTGNPKSQFKALRKLQIAEENDEPFDLAAEEADHLLRKGYIELKKHSGTMPGGIFSFSGYEITESGKTYVTLRKMLTWGERF